MSNYCSYSKCKAVAEYNTPFGKLCPYHFKVLKKKKGINGEKIQIDNSIKKLLKKVRFNPLISIKLKEVKWKED